MVGISYRGDMTPPEKKPEAAHTPGPWVWRDKPCLSDLVSLKGEVMKYDVYEGMWFSRYVEAEDEANARLIAAAPDLLGALKAAVAFIETLHPINLSSSERAITHRLYFEANPDSAIAKAEGRS